MHAQGRIAHEPEMCSIVGTALPATVLGLIVGGIVHAQQHTMADRLTDPHVVEPPIGHSSPYAGQRLTAAQGGTEKVVPVVPIAEVAATGHVEHAPHRQGRGVVLGRCDVVGPIEGEDAIVRCLQSAPAGIGPHVALTVHIAGKGRAIGVAIRDIGVTDQGAHVPVCTARDRITHPLKVVQHKTPFLGDPLLALVLMSLVQVVLQELDLTCGKGRHVLEVHPAYLQFDRGREVAVVELAVTGNVVVLGPLRIGVVHRGIGPISVDLPIVAVAWPGPHMLAVTIGCMIP